MSIREIPKKNSIDLTTTNQNATILRQGATVIDKNTNKVISNNNFMITFVIYTVTWIIVTLWASFVDLIIKKAHIDNQLIYYGFTALITTLFFFLLIKYFKLDTTIGGLL
jgi:hypothetical protein